MSIETWPTLEPGQIRWLGEWEDVGDVSGRFFVGRHARGRMFSGDACATDGYWSVPMAPWQDHRVNGKAPDRDKAKREVERFVADMFGVKAP